MDNMNPALEQVKQRLETLTARFRSLDKQLTSVSRSTQQVTQAVTAAKTAAKAVLTLLNFDEINRLQAQTSSAGKASAETGKVKTGPTEQYDFHLEFTRPPKKQALEFWTQFRLGLREGDNGGEEAGGSLIERIVQGIRDAFGSPNAWVAGNLWSPILTAWTGLGGVAVTVGAELSTTAGELWNNFKTAWGNNRVVQVANQLKNSASELWTSFKIAWGESRAAQIVNSLSNTAAGLWGGFSTQWSIASKTGVTIENKLTDSANSLWASFKGAWGTPTVGVQASVSSQIKVSDLISPEAVKLAVRNSTTKQQIGTFTVARMAKGGLISAETLFPGGVLAGEDGVEAIVPLENHTEWLDKVADRLVAALSGGSGLQQPVVIHNYLQLDRKTLGENVVTYINGQAAATGVNPLSAYL